MLPRFSNQPLLGVRLCISQRRKAPHEEDCVALLPFPFLSDRRRRHRNQSHGELPRSDILICQVMI